MNSFDVYSTISPQDMIRQRVLSWHHRLAQFLFILLIATPLTHAQQHEHGALSLTIYNTQFGIVTDTRTLRLPEGSTELMISGFPNTLWRPSLIIESDAPISGIILSDSDPEKTPRESLYSRLKTLIGSTATLKDKYGNSITGIVKEVKDYHVMIEESPSTTGLNYYLSVTDLAFIGSKALTASIEEPSTGQHRVRLSFSKRPPASFTARLIYECATLSWFSDYVLVLSDNEKTGQLSLSYIVNNPTGTAFNDIQLNLFSGDIHWTDKQYNSFSGRYAVLGTGDGIGGLSRALENQIDVSSFSDYFLYRVPVPISLPKYSERRLDAFAPRAVSVEKKYRISFQSNPFYFNGGIGFGGGSSETQRTQAKILYDLPNTTRNNLGLFLPKGGVRLFKADSKGKLEFLGESLLPNHTPNGDVFTIITGESSSLFGKEELIEKKELGKKSSEFQFQATCTNRSDKESQTLECIRTFEIPVTVLSSSVPFKKINASTYSFSLTLPPDKSVSVSYRIKADQR